MCRAFSCPRTRLGSNQRRFKMAVRQQAQPDGRAQHARRARPEVETIQPGKPYQKPSLRTGFFHARVDENQRFKWCYVSWAAWMKRSAIRETIPSTPPGFRAFGLDPGYGTWRNTCQWCQAASTLRTKSKEARAAPFRDLSGIHPKGPKVGLTTCLGPSAGCWPLSAQGSQSGPSCRL